MVPSRSWRFAAGVARRPRDAWARRAATAWSPRTRRAPVRSRAGGRARDRGRRAPGRGAGLVDGQLANRPREARAGAELREPHVAGPLGREAELDAAPAHASHRMPAGPVEGPVVGRRRRGRRSSAGRRATGPRGAPGAPPGRPAARGSPSPTSWGPPRSTWIQSSNRGPPGGSRGSARPGRSCGARAPAGVRRWRSIPPRGSRDARPARGGSRCGAASRAAGSRWPRRRRRRPGSGRVRGAGRPRGRRRGDAPSTRSASGGYRSW